jgi:hypothetical protein
MKVLVKLQSGGGEKSASVICVGHSADSIAAKKK